MDDELILEPLLRGGERSSSRGCGPIVGLTTGAPLGMHATITGVDAYGGMPKTIESHLAS